MASTVVVKGMPSDVPIKILAVNLDKLFDTDDIGTFRVRELGIKCPTQWQAAIDFTSAYDAYTAQSMLNGYQLNFKGGNIFVLQAKVTANPSLMSTEWEHLAMEKWHEEMSDGYLLNMNPEQMEYCNSALDTKLELLRKQKLILQTERELLEEKRRLEEEYKKALEAEEGIVQHRPSRRDRSKERKKSSRSRDRHRSLEISKQFKCMARSSIENSPESRSSEEHYRTSPKRAIEPYGHSTNNRFLSPDSPQRHKSKLRSPERSYKSDVPNPPDSSKSLILYTAVREQSNRLRYHSPELPKSYQLNRPQSPDDVRSTKKLYSPKKYKSHRHYSPEHERAQKYRSPRRDRSPRRLNSRSPKTRRLSSRPLSTIRLSSRSPRTRRLSSRSSKTRRLSSRSSRTRRLSSRSPSTRRLSSRSSRTRRLVSPAYSSDNKTRRLHTPSRERNSKYEQFDLRYDSERSTDSRSKERDLKRRSHSRSVSPTAKTRIYSRSERDRRTSGRSSISPEYSKRSSSYRASRESGRSRSRRRSRSKMTDKQLIKDIKIESKDDTVNETRCCSYDQPSTSKDLETVAKYHGNIFPALECTQPLDPSNKIQEIVNKVPETPKVIGVIVKDEVIVASDEFKTQLNQAIREIMAHYQILVNKVSNKNALIDADKKSILKIWQSILCRRIRSMKLNSFMLANDIVCDYMSAYTESDDSALIQKLIGQIRMPGIDIDGDSQPLPKILDDTPDSKIWFIVDEVLRDIEIDYFADNDDAETVVLERLDEPSSESGSHTPVHINIKIESACAVPHTELQTPKLERITPLICASSPVTSESSRATPLSQILPILPKWEPVNPKRKKGPPRRPLNFTSDISQKTIPENPKFFISVKNILKKIKPYVMQLGGDMNVIRVLDIATYEIRKQISVLLADKKYMKSAQITELYRQAHPTSKDLQFVLDLLEKIKQGVYSSIEDSLGDDRKANIKKEKSYDNEKKKISLQEDDDVVIIEGHDVITLSDDDDVSDVQMSLMISDDDYLLISRDLSKPQMAHVHPAQYVG